MENPLLRIYDGAYDLTYIIHIHIPTFLKITQNIPSTTDYALKGIATVIAAE